MTHFGPDVINISIKRPVREKLENQLVIEKSIKYGIRDMY